MEINENGAGTIRQQMMTLLSERPMTARELSTALSIREKEVGDHLSHLSRTALAGGLRLETDPAICLSCGFEFRNRRRFTKPGRCPKCRRTHLEPPVFRVGSASLPDRCAKRHF